MRVLLTAGFDAAPHAVALAELARRAGHEIVGVLVVRALHAARMRTWIRRRGARGLLLAARRWLGSRSADRRDAAVHELSLQHSIAARSMSRWCREHGVPRCVVRDLNDHRSCAFARAVRPDRTLYAGGGILRASFLDAAGGRVLNAHAGPLPEVRGMNACEWSLLLGHAPSVTIHWIDLGIDTGAPLEHIEVPVAPGDDIDTLRGKCTVAGIQGLLRALDAEVAEPAAALPQSPARQCFTLAPALRELLELRLARAAHHETRRA